MPGQAKIHWLAPTIIAISLASAVLLAVGHHLYNARLDKTIVPTSHYDVAGHSISAQQFDISVGTAFAFLVRMLLLTAMSTAYVQIFWYNVRQVSPHPTLKQLDWTRDIASNMFAIVDFKTTVKHPLLLVLALVIWLVPVGTIFPPGTLSVVSSPQQQISRINVPTFDFTTYKYVGRILYNNADPKNSFWNYTGPSSQLMQLSASILASGTVRDLEVPAVQAHWRSDAVLPNMRCTNVSRETRDAIFTNIWNTYRSDPSQPTYGSVPTVYRYLAWVPWDETSVAEIKPSNRQSDNNLPFQKDYSGPRTSTLTINAPAVVWIAIMSQMPDIFITSAAYTVKDNQGADIYADPSTYNDSSTASELIFNWRNLLYCRLKHIDSIYDDYSCSTTLSETNGSTTPFRPADVYQDANLLRCQLSAATYAITVNVTDGRPVISLSKDASKPEESLNSSYYFNGPAIEKDSGTGIVSTTRQDCDGTNTTLSCALGISAIQTMAFQGMFDAFNQYVVGNSRPKLALPAIARTVLALSNELSFLRRSRDDPSTMLLGTNLPDLQTVVTGISNSSLQVAASMGTSLAASKTLAESIEELFQNFTLSLLSSPYFRAEYNSASTRAPSSLTNVTIDLDAVTLYVYNVAVLWAAYGSSLLGVIIIVTLGLVSMLKTGVSYSNKFSTIVRVARTADLSAEVREADASGADPLPEHLKRAQLDVSGVVEHKGYHRASKGHAEDTAYHGASDETVGAG